MMEKSNLGKLGEEIVKDSLKKKGYELIEQNWKTKRAEIDLVMRKKGIMVFIEVRSRRGEQFGTPEDTINWKKRRKLFNNAKAYVAIKKYMGPYQIDAVCIVFSGNGIPIPTRVSHYEDIIEEGRDGQIA